MTDLGLYIHVPFCVKKCNYCDFYSFAADDSAKKIYTARVTEEIKRWGVRIVRPIDSIYFGGGTPSLLGGESIKEILSAVSGAFELNDPEITLECNPADNLDETLYTSAMAGVNRISLGVQSAVESELSVLGRRHRNSDVGKTVAAAHAAGISNISMDIMLGLPFGSMANVTTTLNEVLSHSPSHISVYMLKTEEGTPFYEMPRSAFPDEESEREQYLFVSAELKKHGYSHYEISNFARDGFESRHNLKYWNCDEYLGIGPAAHSFLNGRRFFYPQDFGAFVNGTPVSDDGAGGGAGEYIMLRLRLADGLNFRDYSDRFGEGAEKLLKTAERLVPTGLVKLTDKGVSLTEEGFLLSNAVIGEFI